MYETTCDAIVRPDIRICQPAAGFRFTVDSVLLARFAHVKRKDRVADIGAGSGIIGILLAKLKNAPSVTAVELQDEMFFCLESSVASSEVGGIVHPVQADVREYRPDTLFDLVVANPPYRLAGTGREAAGQARSLARQATTLTLSDVYEFCRKYVKDGGRLAFVIDADLAGEALARCRESRLETKRLRFMHPAPGKPARLAFIECVKNAGVEMTVEPPLFQHDETGQQTEEYAGILKGEWD